MSSKSFPKIKVSFSPNFSRSQNDKLRAEIEAQATAHKAQYTALETRSHDAWLAARQAERRLEESRNESSALRRKLTVLGDVSVNNSTSGK